jgi:hypothetical protein
MARRDAQPLRRRIRATVQAPDCGARAGPSNFAAGLIRLSLDGRNLAAGPRNDSAALVRPPGGRRDGEGHDQGQNVTVESRADAVLALQLLEFLRKVKTVVDLR